MPDINPIVVSIKPHYFRVGDYCCIINDFPSEILLGLGFILICKSEIQQLTLAQPNSVKNYLERAITSFEYHKINKKLNKIDRNWESTIQIEREERQNLLDKEVIDILISLEKKYRNLRAGIVEYSPELSKLGLT